MAIRQRSARFILRRLGWTCLDVTPRPDRAVLVVYPHTSNWDFPLGLLAAIEPGADIDADLATLAECYRDCRGLRPEHAAPIRRR